MRDVGNKTHHFHFSQPENHNASQMISIMFENQPQLTVQGPSITAQAGMKQLLKGSREILPGHLMAVECPM